MSRTITQMVQYGSDLAGCMGMLIPMTGAGAVTITPGMPSDRVRFFIPNPERKVFARHKMVEVP